MQRISYTVLLILITLTSCSGGGQYSEMRQRLDALNELNRADSVLTVKERDEAQALADYFDSHGTPNDQLLAHYLLGRCYADMHEAPMALHCYQEAITRADTTAKDCDYTELMAVYGQMADLYHLQNLPMDEIEASEKYQHYALLANDTLKFIRNIQLMVKPYYLLGDTEKILEVMDTAQKLYLKYGYKKEAAGVYATPIFIMTQRGQLTEARRMIHEFEHKSGLFDGNGNICKGREAYYYTRGLFCLAVNELDSAEIYMRRLLPLQYEVEAYRGLLQVYRRRKNADSISKFSLLYETALDTLHNNIRTETIRKMTAMYDYQRFQELAAKKETEARTMWVAFSFAFFALLCLLLILSILVWAYRQNKLHKLQLLTTNLSKTTEDYHLAQHELEMLSSKSDKEQKEKKKEVAQLKEKLNQYIAQLQTIKPTTHITPDNLVIKKFKSKTYYKGNAGKATDGNWRELTELFINALPRTYAFIAREGTLTPLELRVCLLILLNFQNGEIATLLATSSQSITNTKSSANQKLFHDSSASTLLKKLKSYSREHDKV